MSTLIHWFRRDLRLADNSALAAAVKVGSVIPLFIYDDHILSRLDTGGQRVSFLAQSLDVLDANLRERGSRLLILRGKVDEQLLRVAQELGVAAVFFNRDYEPYSRQRDEGVIATLQAAGIAVNTYSSHLLTEPDALLTKQGKPYTVYTPYKRAALERLFSAPPLAPAAPTRHELQLTDELLAKLDALHMGAPPDLLTAVVPRHQPAGEDAGRERLAEFIQSKAEYDGASGSRLSLYAIGRNLPAAPGSARISAHLRMGTLGVRTCYLAAVQQWQATRAAEVPVQRRPRTADADYNDHNAAPAQRNGAETWIGELLWRDFYYQVMWHFPYIETEPFQRKYAALNFRDAPADLQAWQEGRTGYPIVDAGMRQMHSEAWMHNRLRMIVANFLVKDLRIDYREGERIFMLHLEDGDLAANNGGWQWCASTGTDAQPYFRIFNPITQSEKLDLHGEYIRRYVPELANVPTKYIHTPWTMPPDAQQQAGCRIGQDYPAPIVDHAEARKAALAMYQAIAPSPRNQLEPEDTTSQR